MGTSEEQAVLVCLLRQNFTLAQAGLEPRVIPLL